MLRVVVFAGNIISIHALREEGDLVVSSHETKKERFQSTPSARRATCRLRFRWS